VIDGELDLLLELNLWFSRYEIDWANKLTSIRENKWSTEG